MQLEQNHEKYNRSMMYGLFPLPGANDQIQKIILFRIISKQKKENICNIFYNLTTISW